MKSPEWALLLCRYIRWCGRRISHIIKLAKLSNSPTLETERLRTNPYYTCRVFVHKMDGHRGSSPMDYIPLQKFLLTAMNVVEDPNRSPIIKQAHGTVLFIWRTFFLHVGCILQNVALFTAQTPAAALRVPFVALTVTKLVIKGAVFLIGRRELDEMWQSLKDEGSRTKNAQEMK